MAAPVVCLAENKAEFVRDCWAALDRKDTDPIVIAGLPPFSYHGDVPTPLESVLVTSLVYARLSQYMLYDREVDDEADALAASSFEARVTWRTLRTRCGSSSSSAYAKYTRPRERFFCRIKEEAPPPLFV